MVRSQKMVYDDAVRCMREERNSMRLSDLKAILLSLGFVVERGTKGNHYTVTHPPLSASGTGFRGLHFDGGHGTDPQVLPVYINKLRRLVETYQDFFLAEENNGGRDDCG